MTHTTSPNNGDAERADFESWYVQEGGKSRSFMLGRNTDGEYAYAETESMWMAWQERARRSPVADAAAGELPSWADVQAREKDIRALQSEVIELRAELAHKTEAARRWESKLASVWDGIRSAVSKYSGKPCEGEPFDALDALLARTSAPEAAPVGMVLVPVEPTREMVWACKDKFVPRMALPFFVAAYKTMIAAAPMSASAQPAHQVLGADAHDHSEGGHHD